MFGIVIDIVGSVLDKQVCKAKRNIYNALSTDCQYPLTSPESRAGDRIAGDGGVRVE